MAAVMEAPQRKIICNNYPDFAAVCLFIDKFGEILGLLPLDIVRLQEGFECTDDGKRFRHMTMRLYRFF